MKEEVTRYGFKVTLESEVIKKYENFTLYQIFVHRNNEKIPIYRTCGR